MTKKEGSILECPHCHTKIIPKTNNICPACQEDLSYVRDTNPNQVSLIIHESDELPSYCYSCNAETERTVRVSGDDESSLWAALFKSTSPKESSNVIIYIPQCEKCGELEDPEPVDIDYENQTMTFQVHQNFRDRVDRL